MLSGLRARPAPLLLLLLLTSVLSETLAAEGDHISFVIGPFRPRLGPPPIPSREDGASSGARRNQWSRPRPSPVSPGAAWPAPPARVIFLLDESPSESRVAPAAPAGLRSGAALRPPGVCTTPPPPGSGRVRARARVPLFLCFAASSSSSSPLRTPVIGTDWNSESF
ncbi:unnamed protein product [Nyctereutes procyonoides]|uniref:(raccoon dog) hypothetical protein n=1 Tax=Nyctereutes procyonoides TaxID=34880 RepID=A0A811Y6T8_NYCPR|nr:unnamed protein product [Nyctereutes procyonoides]